MGEADLVLISPVIVVVLVEFKLGGRVVPAASGVGASDGWV